MRETERKREGERDFHYNYFFPCFLVKKNLVCVYFIYYAPVASAQSSEHECVCAFFFVFALKEIIIIKGRAFALTLPAHSRARCRARPLALFSQCAHARDNSHILPKVPPWRARAGRQKAFFFAVKIYALARHIFHFCLTRAAAMRIYTFIYPGAAHAIMRIVMRSLILLSDFNVYICVSAFSSFAFDSHTHMLCYCPSAHRRRVYLYIAISQRISTKNVSPSFYSSAVTHTHNLKLSPFSICIAVCTTLPRVCLFVMTNFRDKLMDERRD